MKPFVLGGVSVPPGSRAVIDLPLSVLSDHTAMHMAVKVLHGKKAGPTLFVSAAIHGDEIIGVEIIRRLLEVSALKSLRGTLILVPIVNTYGFVGLSRYLPDRRDLNRCFPGSKNGALAGQLAHKFITEIVQQADYGIDLHSGAIHRDNLPQIRANLSDPIVNEMAKAFGASIVMNSDLRDGSLRQSAQELGCNTLLYEAGEALRFDEPSIRIGVKGILNVLRHVDMLPKAKEGTKKTEPARASSSHWLRAPVGGILRPFKALGQSVEENEVIAIVSDPLGRVNEELRARRTGLIIGRSNLPIVNRGDAIFHVACFESLDDTEDVVTAVELEADTDPMFNGVEIV